MMSSWVGIDCCCWERVHCYKVIGKVESLHLRGSKDITGGHEHLFGNVMSSSLRHLRNLKFLDLSNNDFRGSRIPEFIGSFKQLRYINLSGAEFSGNVTHDDTNGRSIDNYYTAPLQLELIPDRSTTIPQKEYFSSLDVRSSNRRVFTQDELMRATTNYDQSTFLGEGGFGSVHKGVIKRRDGRIASSNIQSQPTHSDVREQWINTRFTYTEYYIVILNNRDMADKEHVKKHKCRRVKLGYLSTINVNRLSGKTWPCQIVRHVLHQCSANFTTNAGSMEIEHMSQVHTHYAERRSKVPVVDILLLWITVEGTTKIGDPKVT
nr:leucine-rich repeat protein [Tanacetum cinerariifolium]